MKEGKPRETLQRRIGVSLWRQIADQIRMEISGTQVETKLPAETILAERFGVNRHTVRSAIAALVSEGVLRSEQGRGTYVTGRARLRYPIGRRTRFSSGLEGQAQNLKTRLLSHATEPANARAAEALGLSTGDPVIRLETIGAADGVPVSRSSAWLDASRFGAIADILIERESMTLALAALGVSDYTRKSTVIAAVHASDEDCTSLKVAPGAIVLVTRLLDIDQSGRPVLFANTRFAADKVELSVD